MSDETHSPIVTCLTSLKTRDRELHNDVLSVGTFLSDQGTLLDRLNITRCFVLPHPPSAREEDEHQDAPPPSVAIIIRTNTPNANNVIQTLVREKCGIGVHVFTHHNAAPVLDGAFSASLISGSEHTQALGALGLGEFTQRIARQQGAGSDRRREA